VVLTNGDGYRIYNAHAPVALDDKLFRSVQISDDVAEAADALRLLTKDELRTKSLGALWRAQSVNKQVRQAVEALFDPGPSEWLVRRLSRSIDGLTAAEIRAALASARITLDFPPPEADVTDVRPRKTAPETADATRTAEAPKTADAPKAAAKYDVTLKQLLDAGLIQRGTQLHQRYLGRR
jgi:hypothetical protein